ncbi:MAG: CDP-glucose 4,6-dehydratase [Deltaproteobacteria bacterium CG_4_10_14_0_2_um_filter_43_8]|nr:MAG: CDP-glucose 4,6-dehydratase [Deltaproteobacteria bacterium CG11_big_fil_rev_8_21_14_0_20_42_23]PJA21892.1 MAG: CDP-glucose 4,6-dehydratase [Deltaproteobacteria bacterium CG_4_10_14_0_2_um_filter_43_8]PJC64524.1 MAG: CDP-glucose 4,6-dehydratase [Deltaproteobacteria bacterium CG_4_9_14_0_2_um_filter_42_21]
MFANVYQGKRVLITGHTGFKGSWLSTWLLKLGAEVTGLSKDVPTQPAMIEELNLNNRMTHIQADVRDLNTLREVVYEVKPDFVFHLAAQAIVSTSYTDPVETMSTNVVGTMNILEALRNFGHPCVAVLITSDKCYNNVEWGWGYRETDGLGGKDIYSGSKGAAELVIKSYFHSFFQKDHPVRLAVGRAGNVIGGGDWAKDRIVVDCMRAWNEKRSVEIRSPNATRPWQHVLEPLSGYLVLGQALKIQSQFHGEAFNFGPRAEQNRTVVELLEALHQQCGFMNSHEAYQVADDIPFHEAGLLKLNCDKALFHLKWESNLEYMETVQFVSDWYKAFYGEKVDMYELTLKQIDHYEQIAVERKRIWARHTSKG